MSQRRLVVEVETTGLDFRKDEIIAIAIIDTSGKVLLDELYGASRKSRWPKMLRLHGITATMVRGKDLVTKHVNEIQSIVEGRSIIAFDVDFHLRFLREAGVVFPSNVRTTDTMKKFARAYGEYDDYHSDPRYQSLQTAAHCVGYSWNGQNGALARARAALAVQLALENGWKQKVQPRTIHCGYVDYFD